jgi:hypothetical protein
MSNLSFKKRGWLQEFPFLTDFVEMDRVADLCVKSVDEKCIRRQSFRHQDEYWMQASTRQELILLSKAGTEIARTRLTKWSWKPKLLNPLTWLPFVEEGETVEEVLDRIEDAERVFSVLEIFSGWSYQGYGLGYPLYHKLVIYRSKHEPLTAVRERLIREAKVSVAA